MKTLNVGTRVTPFKKAQHGDEDEEFSAGETAANLNVSQNNWGVVTVIDDTYIIYSAKKILV